MYDDKLPHSCHLPAPGRNSVAHLQVLKDFPDTNKELLLKDYALNSSILQEMLKMHTHTLNCLNILEFAQRICS
jgi:hypothetical protein